MVASIGAIPVEDPLGARLAALVVGRGVVVGTVEADVKIGGTTLAGVAEADRFARGEHDLVTAGVTAHAGSLLQPAAAREARPAL